MYIYIHTHTRTHPIYIYTHTHPTTVDGDERVGDILPRSHGVYKHGHGSYDLSNGPRLCLRQFIGGGLGRLGREVGQNRLCIRTAYAVHSLCMRIYKQLLYTFCISYNPLYTLQLTFRIITYR